jgi:uncharacterized protein (DUF433 family)
MKTSDVIRIEADNSSLRIDSAYRRVNVRLPGTACATWGQLEPASHEINKSQLERWLTGPVYGRGADLTTEQWFVEKLIRGLYLVHTSVDVDKDIRSGVPVIKDTRFPVARLLAELANGLTINAIADDYDLNVDTLASLLDGMASCLNRPLTK